MSFCHCGNEKSYEECCLPIIQGKKKAETAEELMRARYSSFVEQEIDFIMDTVSPDQTDMMSREAVKKWAKSSKWIKLEIVKTENGQKKDSEGTVEFKAFSNVDGVTQVHHENAKFVKKRSKWYFEDGEPVAAEQIRRDSPKVGRNDPCPCGSGKKFKKCCGK